MLGGAALLADGILTPAVTITTAIEGLRTIPAVHDIMGDNQMNVVVITLIIVCLLFAVQRVGTSRDRPCLRPGHDVLVPVPRRRGAHLRTRQSCCPARVQPAARHQLPAVSQTTMPASYRHRVAALPRHHRCQGPLLRHGPRRPRQHLRHLALRRESSSSCPTSARALGCSPTPATPSSPSSRTSTRSSRCCPKWSVRSASSSPPAPRSSRARHS